MSFPCFKSQGLNMKTSNTVKHYPKTLNYEYMYDCPHIPGNCTKRQQMRPERDRIYELKRQKTVVSWGQTTVST